MSKTNQLRNIHPGVVFREEFLIPLGATQYRLAKEIGVTEEAAKELSGVFAHIHRFEPLAA